jgi:hypothetical protein
MKYLQDLESKYLGREEEWSAIEEKFAIESLPIYERVDVITE